MVLVNLHKQLHVNGLKYKYLEGNNDDAKIFHNLIVISSEDGESEILKGFGDGDVNDGLYNAGMDISECTSEIILAPSNRFEGARIDSGAKRIVSGQSQAELHAILANVKYERTISERAYRFGNGSHECCSVLPTRIRLYLELANISKIVFS